MVGKVITRQGEEKCEIFYCFLFFAEGVDYFSSGLSAHHEALVPQNVVSTLGAGDAFLSGLAYCHLRGIAYPDNILLAQRAAVATMAVSGTYNPNLHSFLW